MTLASKCTAGLLVAALGVSLAGCGTKSAAPVQDTRHTQEAAFAAENRIASPGTENQVKQNALVQDTRATHMLNQADTSRELSRWLAEAKGKGEQAVTAHAKRLQQSHGHLPMLLWMDLAGGHTQTYEHGMPKATGDERQKLRSELSKARKALSGHQAYDSPSFRIGGVRCSLLGRRSTDGKVGVVALVDHRVLDHVAAHQQKNLRLIPYPKEGKFRMESVHADTLQDITVRTGHDNEKASHYYENEIIVRFRDGQPNEEQLQSIKADISAESSRKLGYAYLFRSTDMDFRQLKAYFAGRWQPAYMEPHYMYLTNSAFPENTAEEWAPNDLLFSGYQWNLPAIETGRGWNLSRGSEDIIVAVVDTGVEAGHPDLQGQLLQGYNAVSSGQAPDDDVGHGTHVTGIIGAIVNNAEGVAGISWYNKVLPVKALDATGVGTTYSVAEGIIWAADNGAKVINLSLGNYADSQFLHDAVKYAYDRDIVLVSAAGNDNTERPGYPAAYPEVLAVAATNSAMRRASFSNYGDYIDVAAPGESIASTYPGGQYAALSGTSMASPHVAALAGLVRTLNPSLTNEEVMDLMKRQAIDLGAPGHDKYFGWGQVDIYRTLQAAAGNEVPLQMWPQHIGERLKRLGRLLR